MKRQLKDSDKEEGLAQLTGIACEVNEDCGESGWLTCQEVSG